MRIARVQGAAGPVMAVLDGSTAYAATVAGRTFDDLPALLTASDGQVASIGRGASLGPVQNEALLAPVGLPRKIICIGLNYRLHAQETGQPPPPAPPLFPKWDNALVAPYGDVPLPTVSDNIDYEAELAFFFSRRCKDIAAENAADVLFGFTCANDVSVRDYQRKTGQWTAGKAFDGACPLGPWIVTADELGATPDLRITGRIDGEVMQDSNTGDLIYSVPELIAFVTSIMTIEAGDVVLTGTPSGVGAARQPQRWMKNGESYEVEIEKIGAIKNRFVAR